MADTSKYYRLWVRNGEPGSAWVRVPYLVDLHFVKYVNAIPSFSASVYTRDATLQALLTGNRIFRITNLASADGRCYRWCHGATTGELGGDDGSREIMTGRLNAPAGDQKSATGQTGNLPSLYNVSGSGFAASVDKMRTQGASVLNATGAATVNMAVGVTSIGGYNVSTGWLDTGPASISYTDQPDSLWKVLLDIARIGDGTSHYAYFIEVTHDASFNPVVNYYSPTHASGGGLGAGGDFTLRTSSPFPADTTRIINVKTSCRDAPLYKDRDRVINRLVVRYQGFGTGNQQTDTSQATDATFPEVRSVILYTPLYDVQAANLYRDTVINMFKGTSSGLLRVEAVVKNAQLFTGAFTALLGDQVGLQKDASDTTGIMNDKFLGFEYDQSTEQLTVVVGIPKLPFFDDYAAVARTAQQAFAAMKQTVPGRMGATRANAAQPAVQGFGTYGSGAGFDLQLNFTDKNFVVDSDEAIAIHFLINTRDGGSHVAASETVDVLLYLGGTAVHRERATTDASGVLRKTVYLPAQLVADVFGLGGTTQTLAQLVVTNATTGFQTQTSTKTDSNGDFYTDDTLVLTSPSIDIGASLWADVITTHYHPV